MLNLLSNDQNRRLKDALIELACVERTASLCDATAQIALGISTITAVASGFYNMPVLVFLSAGLNTMSVSLSRYSSTCKRRAISLTVFAKTLASTPPAKELNVVLKSPSSDDSTTPDSTLFNRNNDIPNGVPNGVPNDMPLEISRETSIDITI